MPKPASRQEAPLLEGAAPGARFVLTINSGSSSIKFALYLADSPTTRLLSGRIERIGLPRPVLTIHDSPGKTAPRVIAAPNHLVAGDFLIGWLEEHKSAPTCATCWPARTRTFAPRRP